MRTPMNKKCAVCEPTVIAFIWESDGSEYYREMLRKCRHCRREMLSELYWVDSDYPTCGACLSQELRLREDGSLECAVCGSRNILQFATKESEE